MVYPIAKWMFFKPISLFIRKTSGLENLLKPPFIFAANHESYLDPFLIGSLSVIRLDTKVHYLAMKGRFWRKFGDRICRDWAGCVPLDEGKEKAMKELIVQLKKGDTVGIFPGGPRSLDGNMTRGRTGAVRLALSAKCPIVPVAIIGAYEIAPRDNLIPKLGRCEIKIGKPIFYTQYFGKKVTYSLLRKLTDDLMERIAKLANKKYIF